MRTYIVTVVCIIHSLFVSSQDTDLLKITTHKLDNGLTIFLNEDATASNVFGAVMVNSGAKHESPDATGMAHYLEHMLFKGTDLMGTSNYVKEKPHLDSINLLYDQLAKTTDKIAQSQIQKSINEQAQKAAQYALPTEFSTLLSSIGSTGINAFTNSDMTYYYNSFPNQEIEKWLDIYATRFTNPVFRSFQSELEVVYEEKNRSQDNFINSIFNNMNALLFPDMPYGQWSVLGKTEHLKNPSLTKMYDFYNENYVAGNMAVILSGNFQAEDVLPLIEAKFTSLKSGTIEQPKAPSTQPSEKINTKKVRITPVKVGFLGYRTVPSNHPDKIALDVCQYLLYNEESETGFLNQIQLNNELIYTGAFPIDYNSAGAYIVYYVPKILIQSLNSAEKMIGTAIGKIKQGDFSDQMLAAAKKELSTSFKNRLEQNESRGVLIGEAFNANTPWEEYAKYPRKIDQVSKEEVMRVAEKYFNQPSAKMISRTGFGKKEKLEKPPYKPVTPNQNNSSVYAKKFKTIPSIHSEPKFLDFQNDVNEAILTGGHKIVATKNPINDIFSLQIKFRIGQIQNPGVEETAELINYVGTSSQSLTELKQEFSSLGCRYFVTSSNNYLTLELEGEESSLSDILSLANSLLIDTKADDKSIKLLINELKTSRDIEKRNRNTLGWATMRYATLGDSSPYILRHSVKEIKKMSADDLVDTFKRIASTYQSEIIFTGNTPIDDLKRMLSTQLSLAKESKSERFAILEGLPIEKNKIIIVHDKKAVQSQIYFHVPNTNSEQAKYAEVTAFNEYFGGGFSGLAIQEIREYRSLAYSTWGKYYTPTINNKPVFLRSYIGCQADKTPEAIEVMMGLINDMPTKADRMPALRNSLQMKITTSYPQFRDIPNRIIGYQRQGHTVDPNIQAYNDYQKIEMADINNFYSQHIKGKPYVITIYGDKTSFDLDQLKQFGEITELKLKDIIRF